VLTVEEHELDLLDGEANGQGRRTGGPSGSGGRPAARARLFVTVYASVKYLRQCEALDIPCRLAPETR